MLSYTYEAGNTLYNLNEPSGAQVKQAPQMWGPVSSKRYTLWYVLQNFSS